MSMQRIFEEILEEDFKLYKKSLSISVAEIL